MSAIDDYDAIAKVINQYIEGASKGDIGLLFQIFHEKARLFGEGPPKGTRYDLDRDTYFQKQQEEPLNQGGKYRARLVSMQQLGRPRSPSSRKTVAGATCRSSTSSRCRGSTANGRLSTKPTRGRAVRVDPDRFRDETNAILSQARTDKKREDGRNRRL